MADFQSQIGLALEQTRRWESGRLESRAELLKTLSGLWEILSTADSSSETETSRGVLLDEIQFVVQKTEGTQVPSVEFFAHLELCLNTLGAEVIATGDLANITCTWELLGIETLPDLSSIIPHYLDPEVEPLSERQFES